MSVLEGPGRTALIERVKNILTKTAEEWDKIAPETPTANELMTTYAAPLAVLMGAASLIGGLIPSFAFYYHFWNPIGAVLSSVVGVVLSVGLTYAAGIVLDAIAPSFQVERNLLSSMKLAVYSTTPIWIAGVLTIIPFLRPIAYLGWLYACYLIWVGVPKLLKPPESQATVFALVSMIVICAAQSIAWTWAISVY